MNFPGENGIPELQNPNSEPYNFNNTPHTLNPIRKHRRGAVDSMMTPIFENSYFTEMCSGFEAGSYSKLKDVV